MEGGLEIWDFSNKKNKNKCQMNNKYFANVPHSLITSSPVICTSPTAPVPQHPYLYQESWSCLKLPHPATREDNLA